MSRRELASERLWRIAELVMRIALDCDDQIDAWRHRITAIGRR